MDANIIYATIFPSIQTCSGTRFPTVNPEIAKSLGDMRTVVPLNWRATTTRCQIVLDLSFDAHFNGQPVYSNLSNIGNTFAMWQIFQLLFIYIILPRDKRDMSEKLEVGPIYDTKQLPNWRHVMTDPFHAGTVTSPNIMI